METMHSRASKLSRRTFLTGVGVTMGLPWLESLNVWGSRAASTTPTPSPPKRFAALFMGNGISPPHWSARGAGDDVQLGKSLQPLAPLRSRLNVVSGLFN